VAVLAVPDDLARDGRFASARTTQLADDPPLTTGIEVHVLAREWSASAVGAAMPVRLERPETAAQQHQLEQLYMGGR
jgi:hypothetical protein